MARVTLAARWPRMELRLGGFATDSERLEARHERWLQTNIFPILERLKVEIVLVGGASRVGDPDWNHHLSVARMQSVARFLGRVSSRQVYSPRRLPHWNPTGERAARGGARANRSQDRGVALGIWPLGISPNPAARNLVSSERRKARKAMLAEFDRIIANRRVSPGLSGEEREMAWGPIRDRLLGFGFRTRRLVGSWPRGHRHPGNAFVDPITLRPRMHVSERRHRARQMGERDALRVWNRLHPNERWCLLHPQVALELRRELCGRFKRLYERYMTGTRQRWPVGGCEFYTRAEERRRPP